MRKGIYSSQSFPSLQSKFYDLLSIWYKWRGKEVNIEAQKSSESRERDVRVGFVLVGALPYFIKSYNLFKRVKAVVAFPVNWLAVFQFITVVANPSVSFAIFFHICFVRSITTFHKTAVLTPYPGQSQI